MNVRVTQLQPTKIPGTEATAENSHLVYLYCVTHKTPHINQLENAAYNIYVICHNNLCAVAGKVNKDEFSEEGLKRNITDMTWLKEKAGMHEEIIEHVMADADVIPFKFGTLFNTGASLKTMLERHEGEFDAILTKLAHKQEWGVKIYYNREKLKANLGNENPEILKIENEVKSSSAGKNFFLRKKIEQMMEKTLNEKINECSRKCFEMLKELSYGAYVNRLLPKEVTERADEMILNSVFLINKDETLNFQNIVDTLKMRYEGKGFYIDCTGPWPPYYFCKSSGVGKQDE